MYAEKEPGWLRYTASCATKIVLFCGLLWLAI
jgi:hypothetical protein